MNKETKEHLDLLKNNMEIFFNFLKAKYPVFHKSNFFFRDFQFGIRSFFHKKDIDISYAESEYLAKEFGKYLEENDVFIRINNQTWKVNYPDFVTEVPGDPL